MPVHPPVWSAAPPAPMPLDGTTGTALLDGVSLLVKGALEAGFGRILVLAGPLAERIEPHRPTLHASGLDLLVLPDETSVAAVLAQDGADTIRTLLALTATGDWSLPDGAGAGLVVALVAPDATAIDGVLRRLQQQNVAALEPSLPQEIKDWIAIAAYVTETGGRPVALLVTGEQMDAIATVGLRQNVSPRPLPEPVADALPDPSALTTAVAGAGVNTILYPEVLEQPRYGFVAGGSTYTTLQHALHELGMDDQAPIFKLGCAWPPEPESVADYASFVGHLIVLEPTGGFVESWLREQIDPARVHGGTFPTGLPGTDRVALDVPGVMSLLAGLYMRSEGVLREEQPAELAAALALIDRVSKYRLPTGDAGLSITGPEAATLPSGTHLAIVPEICEYCHACWLRDGDAAGWGAVATALGPRIAVAPGSSADDPKHAHPEACPSFVTVRLKRGTGQPGGGGGEPAIGKRTLSRRTAPPPPVAVVPEPLMPDVLPEPNRSNRLANGTFTVLVIGDDGVVATALAEAGRLAGHEVALRRLVRPDDVVVSHVQFFHPRLTLTPRIPVGKADLIIGLDPWAVVSEMPVASHERTALVLHRPAATGPAAPADPRLTGWTRELVLEDARGSLPGEAQSSDPAELAARLLGIAYGRGWVPVRAEQVHAGLAGSDPMTGFALSAAFQSGRAVAAARRMAAPGQPTPVAEPEIGTLSEPAYATVMAEMTALVGEALGKTAAEQFPEMAQARVSALNRLSEGECAGLVRRMADLATWGGLRYATHYADVVLLVHKSDPSPGVEATRAVLHNLHRAMLIKDSVYVARTLTSPIRLAALGRRYGLDERRGDKLSLTPAVSSTLWGPVAPLARTGWGLGLIGRMMWLRNRDGWTKDAQSFREWYESGVVLPAIRGQFPDYWVAVRALEVPGHVRGFGEIWLARAADARRYIARLLDGDTQASLDTPLFATQDEARAWRLAQSAAPN